MKGRSNPGLDYRILSGLGTDITRAAWAWKGGGRHGRHSYQPRATPLVHRPKTFLSAEGAIHHSFSRPPSRRCGVSPRRSFHGTRPGISCLLYTSDAADEED